MRLKHIAAIGAAFAAAAAVAVYATLSSLNFEELRGIAETQVAAATGRELKIAGAVDLQISLNPAIALEDVTFANAQWGSRPTMLTVKRLELEVSLLPLLLGDVRIQRLILVEPDLLLETGKDGRGNWLLAEPSKEEEESGAGTAATLPSFTEVAMKDSRVVYRDDRTGRTYRLHLAGLRVSADSGTSAMTVNMTGAANDTAFTMDGIFGSAAELAADGIFPVKLDAEVAGASLTVDGRIEAPLTRQDLDVAMVLRGTSLADLGTMADTPLPRTASFSLAAQVSRQGPEIKATNIAIQVGGSDLAGNLRADLAGPRPVLAGKLTSSILDLGDFLPAQESAAPDTAPAFLFPEVLLPVEAMAAADVDVTLGAGEVRLRPGVGLTDVDMRLTLKNARLSVEPLSAKLTGGALTGALNLEGRAKPPAFALQLEANDVDYGKLLTGMAVTDGVTGTLKATVDVRGIGVSPRAIAAGLNGRVDIVAGEGRIANKLMANAGTGVLDMFSNWEESGDDMILNCALVRLPVRAGVGTSEAILLDTDTVTVGAEGRVDLRDETLDFRITPQAKKASLLSLAVPFRMSGTLISPQFGVDPLGTALGAAKVAGILLNPLVAGGVLLLESGTADQNPCVAAMQATPGQESPDQTQPGSVVDKATRGVTDTLEGVGEGLNKGLKNLFKD